MNKISKLKRILYCRRELLIALKEHIELIAFKKEWREKNTHNGIVAMNRFDMSKVTVGVGSYGPIRVFGYDNPMEKLMIGSYCSIAGDVIFLLGGEHNYKRLMTYPYETHILNLPKTGCTMSKGPIIIEDDVWIGQGALILSGVHIGKGSIIGSGAVVAKDIPQYAIYVDGRIIRYRFEKDICERLAQINLDDISRLNDEQREYLFKNEIAKENIDMVVEFFEELNRRVRKTSYE